MPLFQRITTRWILLAMVCVARSVEWLTEQPRGSLMPACPYVTFLAMVVKPSYWGRVSLLCSQLALSRLYCLEDQR